MLANFPIHACKNLNFLSHNLRALLIYERSERKIFRLSPLERRKMPLWQVGQKLLSLLIPSQKGNACSHQNLICYCQILEFMLVDEFLIQKLERFAWHSQKFSCSMHFTW